MSSRSATILVIFVVAIIAFCLASVFGAMTGQISILPNKTNESHSVLDNLSAITDGTGDTGKSYGNEYVDYSSKDSSDSKVETTTEDSSSSDSNSGQHQDTQEQPSQDHSSSDQQQDKGSEQKSGDVETTVG